MRLVALVLLLSGCGARFDAATDCREMLACICNWNDARGSFCSGDKPAIAAACADRINGWLPDAGVNLDARFSQCGHLKACAYAECMSR